MIKSSGTILLKCKVCGCEFFVYPYRKDTSKYCSKKCRKLGITGLLLGNRVERSKMKNGYYRVRVNGKYVYEHRHVMEEHLGRKLYKTEIVHHKDHDRGNNNIDNLEVMDKKLHDSMETKKRWEDGTLTFNRNNELCGFIRTSRKVKGKPCGCRKPCHYHNKYEVRDETI